LLAFLKQPEDRPPLKTFDLASGKEKTIEHPSIQDVSNHTAGQLAMGLPGAFGILTPQPVLEISTGATSRQGGQFAYAISGINPEEVYQAGQALQMKMMEQVGTIFAGPPLSDMYLNTPSLEVNILRERAASYGITASRIETQLKNAYSQNYVYLIKKPQDQYQVILEATDRDRTRPEDLAKLYIKSDDDSRLVPLSAVATWNEVLGAAAVNHINQFTSVTWNFNLLPGVPIDTATSFIENAAKEVVPSHIRGQFQGEALTFRETMSSLTILMVLAVFVMYVILAILYESYLHPITVLSTLPTAMVGGLLTLWLFGQEASLYAFIGLFMLMGIVKKNGIMIVDFAIQRVAAGESAEKSIHDASMDRFRPILMTTLAAIMGAVPIAFALGASGAERRPLGMVIVGGLVVSQLITLYVTPVIYLYMELFQEKVLNRVPFLAAHYEGHSHGAALDRPQVEPVATDDRVAVPVTSGGNGDNH
ncbi:MAG: efflux RND transporter permease subunit, partial [Tepidisphaeraceae bacterium]